MASRASQGEHSLTQLVHVGHFASFVPKNFCAVSLTYDNYIQSMVPGCSLDYVGDATKDRIRTSGTIDLDRALDNLSLKHPVKAVRKCGGVHVC